MLVVLGGSLNRSFRRTQVHIKPHHILLRHRGVNGFAEGDGIDLSCPDPEARGDTAQRQGAERQPDELKGGKTDTAEESILGGLWRIGGEWELGKRVKGLADNKGHERGNASCDEGRKDGGDDQA